MDFQTKMLLGTFAVTVLLGLIIVPILRKLKVGQIERTDGPQSHLKKQGTPTMGGIIIMLGIIIATCCAYVYYKGKDASLAELLSQLGIKREELIACGDGLNDISMIKYAGLGIAMKNAYDEVKNNADMVTDLNNDENAVADVINRFIINEQ